MKKIPVFVRRMVVKAVEESCRKGGSTGAAQGFEVGNTLGTLRPQRTPEVPIQLQTEPEIGARARNLSEPQGRIGRHAPGTM